jgi:hypothetical protein
LEVKRRSISVHQCLLPPQRKIMAVWRTTGALRTWRSLQTMSFGGDNIELSRPAASAQPRQLLPNVCPALGAKLKGSASTC